MINLLISGFSTHDHCNSIQVFAACFKFFKKLPAFEPAIQLMLQEQNAIDNILSKQRQTDAASKAGFSLLNTYYLTGDCPWFTEAGWSDLGASGLFG